MKRFAIPVLAAIFISCQQSPILSNTNLSALELRIGGAVGTSSTSRVMLLQPQLGTIREGDVTFTNLTTVSTQNDLAYDYVQAQFRITNNSATAFNNLTLYAVAKNNNLAGTAIKAITNFGGQDDTAERIRLVKLVTPMHGVNVNASGLSLIAGRTDFQAFEQGEQTDLQTALNNNQGGFSSADKALGYGFVARRCIPDCTNPTSFVRGIPANGTTGYDQGLLTIALRIPRSTGTAYNFLMTFAVVNETVKRVTRSVYPPESLGAAENRLTALGSSASTDEVMQLGLARGISTTRTNKGADVVSVSSDAVNGNADYTALGLERFESGDFHTCALSASGKAYCWGSNGSGRLGDGSTIRKLVPTLVSDPTAGAVTFLSISAGSSHTCALSTAGKAYCWGFNGSGQLGDNSTVLKTVPTLVSGMLNFSSITGGDSHTCGITTTGTAYCWGYNFNGRLGDDSTTNRLVPTQVGTLNFSSITAGASHTCGITTTGTAYCWGSNSSRQLGDGSTINRLRPTQVSGTLNFSSISAGEDHTCGISSGTAYCWGANGSGQLGKPFYISVPTRDAALSFKL